MRCSNQLSCEATDTGNIKAHANNGNIKAHASNSKHEACVLAKQQREQQERGLMNIFQSLRQMSSNTEESYLISLILL